MEDNNKLIPIAQNNLVTKVNASISITNKLLAENNRQLVVEIFERNPKLFIDLISKYYPLQEKTIRDYQDHLNWELLSGNENLNWTQEFIIEFEEKLKWNSLGIKYNKSFLWNERSILTLANKIGWSIVSSFRIPFNEEFIEKHLDKWDWSDKHFEQHMSGLSCNENLLWSKVFIEKHKELINWDALCFNKKIVFDITFISNYKDYINWHYLSIDETIKFTEELISKFEHYWDWANLSSNKNIPWNIELIDKYIDKWDWASLSYNQNLPWSIELLEKYIDKWDWFLLIGNESLPWEEKIIEKYNERWGWFFDVGQKHLLKKLRYLRKYPNSTDNIYQVGTSNKHLTFNHDFINENSQYFGRVTWILISRNRNTNWSIELLEKYSDKWNWSDLSCNKSLPWSIELIERFKNQWNWKFLIFNIAKLLPYSIVEFIEKFQENLDSDTLSSLKKLPWSVELIEKYNGKWDWIELSNNQDLPWTIELIERFEHKFDWYRLSFNEKVTSSVKLLNKFAENFSSSDNLWKTLQKHLDNELIDEVLEKIAKEGYE